MAEFLGEISMTDVVGEKLQEIFCAMRWQHHGGDVNGRHCAVRK